MCGTRLRAKFDYVVTLPCSSGRWGGEVHFGSNDSTVHDGEVKLTELRCSCAWAFK